MLRHGARLLALGIAFLALALPARAQVPDTTRAAPPDTVAVDPAAADTTMRSRTGRRPGQPPRPPLDYAAAEAGVPLHRVPPILQPALDAQTLLHDWPGSFVYDFGTVGWPDGWSAEGLSPQRPTLVLGGIPFDDLLTGRPRYDLLPLEWLVPLRVAPTRFGAPYAVVAHPRPFPAPEPLTLLRYRTRGNGLQSVMALHVQQRRLTLFGRPGVVQIVGGYGGHANDGVYGGSRLRRMRQLYGRLRYAHPRWSIEISELHNRRHIGAHSGIQPLGADYSGVFFPSLAQVVNRGAERQTIRNDLSITARARLLDRLAAPLTVTSYWTAQTARYLPGTDTLGARIDRNGLRAYQDVTMGRQHLRVQLDARWDRIAPTRGLAHSAASGSIQRVDLTVRDSTTVVGTRLVAEGAAHVADDLPPLTGSVTISRGTSRSVFATALLSGQPVPWTARHGFGATLQQVNDVPVGRVARLRVGASAEVAAFDVSVVAFAHRLTDALDYVRSATGISDTIRAVVHGEPIHRLGATFRVDFRRDAERGIYGFAEATAYHIPDADRRPAASPNDLQLEARLASSLPEATARGRLGARYVLFSGDLNLDVYLRGQSWTPFRSRVFHAPTGLFALPPVDARTLGPSGVLDLFVEAGIRAATVFIAYENGLAGRVYHGTLLVPDYPLPGRRLRIGVYWPITG